MKQLRPRALTVYTKHPNEVHETFLARQTHEEFIKAYDTINTSNTLVNIDFDKKPLPTSSHFWR
jgi:FMN-dependent NADH-azoreductase